MAVFIVLWPCLSTTILSCLQKNNFGYTNQGKWLYVLIIEIIVLHFQAQQIQQQLNYLVLIDHSPYLSAYIYIFDMKSDDYELLSWQLEDFFWFEKHTNLTKSEFNNDWIDPYDSIWLKLLTVMLYAIEIFESLIMITFVNYETAGYFGHYRTLINQLLSHLYGGVSIFPITLNQDI